MYDESFTDWVFDVVLASGPQSTNMEVCPTLQRKHGGIVHFQAVGRASLLVFVAVVFAGCGGSEVAPVPSSDAPAPDVTLSLPEGENSQDSAIPEPVPSLRLVQTITLGDSAADGVPSPDNSMLYVVDVVEQQVLFIDLTNQQITTAVPTGTEPFSISLSPDGRTIYVPNAGDGSLTTIKTSQPSKVQRVDLGGRPLYSVPSPDRGRLYVANISKREITVLNAPEVRVDTAIPSAGMTLAITSDGGRLYVAGEGNSVAVIDTVALQVVGQIRLEGVAQALAISPDGRTLYASGGDIRGITAVDSRSGERVGFFPTDDYIYDFTLSPDGRHLYATTASDVVVVDTQFWTLIDSLRVDELGSRIAASENGSRLYVFTSFAGRVLVIDTGV